ncbi:MAG: DUF58 domain-containing protein [Actinomycetota bacterium]
MPTRAGYATVGFAVLCLAAGRLFGLFELYIVAAAALALVVGAIAWVVINWRGLTADRAVTPARLHVGSQSVVTLALSNRRIIPTPVARITDEVNGVPRADAQVPPLGRRQATRASYRVPAERRGLVALGPMRTTVTDPFALASSRRISAPDTSVLVLPAYDDISPPPQPSGSIAHRADRSPGRIGAHGDEFSSLRDYVVGDDLRKVHWPSTARSGDLVVRTEHVPEHGDTLVLLDVRAQAAAEATFERMVSAATSVVLACQRRGDTLRFKTTGGEDMTAEDDAGFDRILDRLALISPVASGLIEVTQERGRATEAAVVVLGDDNGILEDLGPRQGIPADTYVVRFKTEAKAAAENPAVLSRRMTTVGPNDDFATMWTALIGGGVATTPSDR